MKRLFTLLAVVAFMFAAVAQSAARELHITPEPSYVEMHQGEFLFNEKTKIVVCDDLWAVADLFAKDMAEKLGAKKPLATVKRGKGIKIRTDRFVPAEGYEMTISEQEGVLIIGGSAQGVFYGLETLKQIINETDGHLPYCFISDEPNFEYRGAHFDVCRHFFTVEDVKEYIDILAAHKLNRLHWHLTDDQGWRIEIKAYPELTEKGAWRKETLIGHGLEPKWWDGKPHGGYYTQEEIREVVAYAAERFITVIPEIEMPGHSQAALHALPWLGCEEQEVDVWTMWGVTPEVLCAGKETTYTFLENVLKEVIELFPSELIHIGGDECPKDRWKVCPDCQAMIEREGLKSEEELQGYLVARIEKFLIANGRKMIGWDEILDGGVTPTATVMSWRGIQGGIYAAKLGNEVVMTPISHCYFDFYQTESREGEGLRIGGYTPFEKIYAWDPYKGFGEEERKYIKGVQCNLWSEYLLDFDYVCEMLLPRLAAMAEVQWATDRRDESRIRQKMEVLRSYYELNGWHYAPYYFDGRK